MIAIIGILAALGIPVSFVALIIQAIRRKRKRAPLIWLLICTSLFVGAASTDSDSDSRHADLSAAQQASFSDTRGFGSVGTESTPEPTPVPAPTPTPEPPPAQEPERAVIQYNSDVIQNASSSGYNFDTYNNVEQQQTTELVLNTNSKKIHHPWCSSVPKIAPQNYETTTESIDSLIAKGYTLCKQKGDWDD